MRDVRKTVEYVIKHNLKIQYLYKVVMSGVFKFIGLFVRTDEKMFLFNGLGSKYNDSPRAIYEYIIKNNLFEGFKFVWAVDQPEKYNIPNCTILKMDTFMYFITALRAKCWISCVNIERGLNFKKRKTLYLNTWHGTPIKRIGNAVDGRKDFNFSNVDLFCCAGEYDKAIYNTDLNVNYSNFLVSGLPRNDELYNADENMVAMCRNRLDIPKGKKVLLYAPTWRDSKDGGRSYLLNSPLNINSIQEELQDQYVLLLRTHAYTNRIVGIEFNGFIRNVTDYPRLNDLLIVADILISDYSATIFDYSILGKPIICFGYDYEDYEVERGFYIDLEKELPGGVLKTQEELVYKIKTLDYKEESVRASQFHKKYISVGGNATEVCVGKLLDDINQNSSV